MEHQPQPITARIYLRWNPKTGRYDVTEETVPPTNCAPQAQGAERKEVRS